VSGEKISRLGRVLETFGAAIGSTPTGYSVRLAVHGDEAVYAVEEAVSLVRNGAAEVGLPEWPIVEVEAIEWAEFESRMNDPPPALVGIAEIAALLGTSRRRAASLVRGSSFPRPYAELASGPVWFLPNIEFALADWRRSQGRQGKRG
jgi:hypothetical protein